MKLWSIKIELNKNSFSAPITSKNLNQTNKLGSVAQPKKIMLLFLDYRTSFFHPVKKRSLVNSKKKDASILYFESKILTD